MRKPVLIGDFLHRIKRPVDLDSASSYKLVTIKLYHKGVVLREEKLGADIKSNVYLVKEGDFILSGIDARNGAFGIVPPELDGAVVTNDFWYFEIDDEVVDKDFFLELTATQWFDEICRKGSDGTTQRIRLQKDKFFNQPIYLPNLTEQRIFNKRFQAIKMSNKALTSEFTHQQTLLKKLRQQILQEAIEGKLTANWRAQNPDVEPASELLKRIAAEKAQLIKDKKIKAQKPLPPITDEEKPFELPQGWEWCRLDQLIYESPRNGYSPKTVDYSTSTKTLKLGATTSGRFDSTQIKYIDEKIPRDSFLWIKPRDILIQRGNSIDFVGVSAIYQGEENSFIYPDLMMKLRPVNAISEVFLHHTLMGPRCREYFRSNAAGAQKSMPKINQAVVSGTLVPLCCEEEQQAIVTKVEKLLALCDQLETQISQNQTHAENLMQAVLKEAFSHNSKIEPVLITPQASAHLPRWRR